MATYTQAEVTALLGVTERGTVTFPYFIPMSGITDTTFSLFGGISIQATGQTGDYLTTFAINNNHAYFGIAAQVGAGTFTVTGDRIDETTGGITLGVVEVVTVPDGSVGKLFQTLGKFQNILGLTIAGFTSVEYTLGGIGYFDASNRPFAVRGYRLDVKTSGSTADLRQSIKAVKNRGGNEIELVDLDDIGFDSTSSNGQLFDYVREGGVYYTSPVNLVSNNANQVFKRIDIAQYIGTDANIDGDNNEGIIINYSGEPSGGLSSIDHATLHLSLSNQIE